MIWAANQFIAEVRDRFVLQQMPQDGDVFFGRVMLPLLFYLLSPNSRIRASSDGATVLKYDVPRDRMNVLGPGRNTRVRRGSGAMLEPLRST